MTTALAQAADPWRSQFTGADVCREAGLTLPVGVRPVFDDDLWDFTQVIGLPVQMPLYSRRFDFTAIPGPQWRLVAKELIFAMLAPRHEAVAMLSRAYRTPVHLSTAYGRLFELTGFLAWLTGRGIGSLSEIDDDCCHAYLAHRRYVRDLDGVVVGELSPATRRNAAQIIVDLLSYGELFTADRLPAGLRPWGGASASAIAEMPSGKTINKTPPLADELLQPMLAAALYLVTTFGPHAAGLNRQIRETGQIKPREAPRDIPAGQITSLLREYERAGDPFPLLPGRYIRERLDAGWDPDDPLLPIALSHLAHQAGFKQFHHHWIPQLRARLEATLSLVGAEKHFGRNAAITDRADGAGTLPWTLPLHRLQAVALVGIIRTATITVIAAISGMRASELMELQVGCRRLEESSPGLVRYRIASKVVKGQPLGGTQDEWVVIQPVYQAVELAEQLHDDPREGEPLFGRFEFGIRYKWFRNWVNSPAGQRAGLAPIPEAPVSFRALRRTLAIELAYRPGGVLAANVNGQVAVPAGGQVKVPSPRVDQVLFRVVPFLALASRIR